MVLWYTHWGRLCLAGVCPCGNCCCRNLVVGDGHRGDLVCEGGCEGDGEGGEGLGTTLSERDEEGEAVAGGGVLGDGERVWGGVLGGKGGGGKKGKEEAVKRDGGGRGKR